MIKIVLDQPHFVTMIPWAVIALIGQVSKLDRLVLGWRAISKAQPGKVHLVLEALTKWGKGNVKSRGE
jgi:hypothetical protein